MVKLIVTGGSLTRKVTSLSYGRGNLVNKDAKLQTNHSTVAAISLSPMTKDATSELAGFFPHS